MADNNYIVTVQAEPDGPEAELRERFAVIAAYRLATLDERDGYYPEVGGEFDMLDCFEGKFMWDMTDEELEQTPPSRVDFEVVSVDPVERPANGSDIRVVVRVPF